MKHRSLIFLLNLKCLHIPLWLLWIHFVEWLWVYPIAPLWLGYQIALQFEHMTQCTNRP